MTAQSSATLSSSLLSGSADKALAGVLDVIAQLKTVYEAESQAIQSRNLDAYIKLQPTKECLTRDYEILVKEIQVRGEAAKSAPIELRTEVIQQQEKLADLAERSADYALSAAESCRRLQERLVEAARLVIQKEDQLTYNPHGSVDAHRSVATSLNQSI